jgi:anthranilate synthase component 2
VDVVRNDVLTVEMIKNQIKPQAVVISPGPGTPDDSGICLELIKTADNSLPLLGVCLGHQAIGQVFGGKVIRAPKPMHGKISPVIHEGKGIFRNLPSPFNATRYHSLIVERESFPDCLEITAHTQDGIIMGLQHKTLPIHGVQFHPESIASEHGHALIKNFLDNPNQH